MRSRWERGVVVRTRRYMEAAQPRVSIQRWNWKGAVFEICRVKNDRKISEFATQGYRESDEEIVLQHLTAPAHLRLHCQSSAKSVNAKDYALGGAFIRSKE